MNWTDIIISAGLIFLVLRQIRGRKLTTAGLIWPVGLVLWAAFDYLKTIPPYTSDITFVVVLAFTGVVLGTACGLLTTVYLFGGAVKAKARPVAAVLWTIGMASRIVFGLFALHGGADIIAKMSSQLNLHAESTWSTALIVMALCEVLSRSAVLGLRRLRIARLPDISKPSSQVARIASLRGANHTGVNVFPASSATD